MNLLLEKILAINRKIAAPLAAVGAYVYTVMPSNSEGFLEAYRANYEVDRVRIHKPFQDPEEKEIYLNMGLSVLKKKILEDLKISATVTEPKAIFFCSKKFHPDHFGSIDGYFSKGCLIDVPLHFNISRSEHFNDFKSQMFLAVPTIIPFKQPKTMEIDWNSDAGKLYENAFMLSSDAKMFALAQEIYRAKIQSLLDPVGLMRSFTVFAGFVLVQGLSYLGKRFVPVMVLGVAFLLFVYSGLKNLYNRRQDKKTIVALAELGPEYLKGGIEYYQKRMQGNKSARTLLGQDGPKVFTVTGNEVLPIYKFQPLVDNEKLDILQNIDKTSEPENV